MTLAFAFKHGNRIWAATDRRIWLDHHYILQDKYYLTEDKKYLILSSGTAASSKEIDNIIQDYLNNSERDFEINCVLNKKTSSINELLPDSDYNGLVIGNEGIFLIDGKLACFNAGNYWAIGLQHDAAKALIESFYYYEIHLGQTQCQDIFTILSRIEYMIPYNLSEIDIFCFENGEWQEKN